MRGTRWIAGSHVHGCWIGWYERKKQAALAAAVRPGQTAYDLGANVGFYTVLASRLVGPGGRVLAFEPAPRNLRYLRRHVAENRLSNVTILDVAVSDRAGSAMFDDSRGPAMGFVNEAGKVPVRLVALDDLVEDGTCPAPDVMKIDIEGAEAAALRGCLRTLAAHRPVIFLATHGDAVHAECRAILAGLGYRVESLDDEPVETTRELLCRG